MSKPMLERTDPQQDAKRFVDGMGELRRRAELWRLEEAAKQFLRDTGVGPIADHMSVHAWMAAFAYTQLQTLEAACQSLLAGKVNALEQIRERLDLEVKK